MHPSRRAELYPSRRVEPWGEDLRQVRHASVEEVADVALEADGRHAWLAESPYAFVFLRRIEVGTSRVASCLVAKVPSRW